MTLQGPAPKWALWAGLAVGAVALIWFWRRGAAGVASDIASGAVGAAAGAASGAVLGIGDAIGVPRTNAGMCEFAKKEGSWSDVAAYCPAGDALSWGFKNITGGGSPSAGDLK